ncbi:MAG TPA: hypothetical protein DCX95_01100 [Elusimicrobia bacterium]|nr:hypothetical protein [Elusimicrobiota bacterium]
MGTTTVLQNIDFEELQTLIKKAVREELSALSRYHGYPEFITREELGKRLHLSLVSIDKHIRAGKLKAHRIGNRVLIDPTEINFETYPFRKYLPRK